MFLGCEAATTVATATSHQRTERTNYCRRSDIHREAGWSWRIRAESRPRHGDDDDGDDGDDSGRETTTLPEVMR
jgi:hypothetical protein